MSGGLPGVSLSLAAHTPPLLPKLSGRVSRMGGNGPDPFLHSNSLAGTPAC